MEEVIYLFICFTASHELAVLCFPGLFEVIFWFKLMTYFIVQSHLTMTGLLLWTWKRLRSITVTESKGTMQLPKSLAASDFYEFIQLSIQSYKSKHMRVFEKKNPCVILGCILLWGSLKLITAVQYDWWQRFNF